MLKQLAVAGIIAAGLLLSPAAAQPQFDHIQRDRARQMLRDLHDALQHHYYDPQYHGVDMEARFKAADTQLQSANNLGAALTIIGQTLDAGFAYVFPAAFTQYTTGIRLYPADDRRSMFHNGGAAKSGRFRKIGGRR